MKPKIISFVGKSNSGKTTLLEKVVTCLTRKGYRIGTVKHTHHKFDPDKEGTDSWRHRKAGACATMVDMDDKIYMVKEDARTPEEKMMTYLADMDIIIAEGFKRGNFPAIEVFRKESSHRHPLFLDDTAMVGRTMVAFVTDSEYRPDVPVFGLEDVSAISEFIEENFL